jgi:hypothetical protein
VLQLSVARGVKPALRRLLSVATALVLVTGATAPSDSVAAAAPAAGPGASSAAAQVVSAAPAATSPTAGLTAVSASHDPSAPHGFLDDSSIGPAPVGPQPAATGTPTLATGFSSSVIFSGLDHPSAVRFASVGSGCPNNPAIALG